MQVEETVLMWRRIDQPGHEVMRFTSAAEGRRIDGYAAYREAEVPLGLHYSVDIHDDWTTRRAVIEGHAYGRSFTHRIERTGQEWVLDGVTQDGLGDIPHLDLGFTPATNMPQLRHAALEIGEERSFDVAWFDIGRGALERLPQTYRRIGKDRYAYDSPQGGYSAVLELGADGFTILYPDLWERVSA